MDQALNQKIDAYIAQNKEQLLKDIAALVAVNSVEGTPEEGAPYRRRPPCRTGQDAGAGCRHGPCHPQL